MQTFAKRSLEPNYLKVFRISTGIIFLLMAAVPSFVLGVAQELGIIIPILIFLGIWSLLFGLFFWYSIHWYKAYHYTLLDAGLRIHKGVFWQQQHTVPRNRVQHIDITTGPLERRYELSKLVLHTAGTRNASVTLPGLLQDDAAALRQELINTNSTDDTV